MQEGGEEGGGSVAAVGDVYCSVGIGAQLLYRLRLGWGAQAAAYGALYVGAFVQVAVQDELAVVVCRLGVLCHAEGAAEETGQGERTAAVGAVGIARQPVEDERRQGPCHQHYAEHADDGYLGEGMECRVLGYDECADAYEHDEG